MYTTFLPGSCSEEEGNVAVKVTKKTRVANPLVQSVSNAYICTNAAGLLQYCYNSKYCD